MITTEEVNVFIPISTFQKKIMQIDKEINLALVGGRGSAKTTAVALLALEHIAEYGRLAKILYVREYRKSCRQFMHLMQARCDEIGFIPNPDNPDMPIEFYSLNTQDYLFTFFNGATLEMAQIRLVEDYKKHHGKDYTMLIVDELCEFSEFQIFQLVDSLKSCVRAPPSIKTRMIFLANPGGPGHDLVKKRYVDKVTSWIPYIDPVEPSEELLKSVNLSAKDIKVGKWVTCHSTYKDNPFIDQKDYVVKLFAKNEGDPELVKAWIEGSWDISRGSFFDEKVLDPKLGGRNRLVDWNPDLHLVGRHDCWRNNFMFTIGYDHGTSCPAVAHVAAIAKGGLGPDGMLYSPGSIIILDEWTTNTPNSYEVGLTMNIETLAFGIKGLADRWGIPPSGPADDSIFSNIGIGNTYTIANEFRKYGVFFFKAGKGHRPSGWTIMKSYMIAAGKIDLEKRGYENNRPALYICDRCRYFWGTVPKLGYHISKPDDLSGEADHSADCVRYILNYTGASYEMMNQPMVQEFKLWG